LREAVLGLAVRGRLVAQDPADEPAAVLLERIAAERSRLVKEKKIKKSEPLPPVSLDEVPFDLPVGWEWVRLGDIIQISSGSALTSKKMEPGEIPVYGGNGITGFHNQYNVDKNTLIIGRVGFYCGSIHTTNSKSWVTDNAFITYFSKENIHLYFLYWLLKNTDLQVRNNATAQPVISGRKIYPIPVSLPPLAEQKRIVEAVDRLMEQLDRLEAQQTQQRDRLKILGTTATTQLTGAAETRDRVWPLVRDRFATIYDTPENVEQLRQTILQLAVMGRLVPQHLDISDAKSKTLLKDFVKVQNGYAFKSKWFSDSGIKLLRNANIGHDEICWENVAKIPSDRSKEFERFSLCEGDIIISLDRPLISTGLKSSRVRKSDLPCLLLQRVGRFQILSKDKIDENFLFMWLNSPEFITYYRSRT
jgi:type I restriction enzyme S subunit